MAFPRRFESRVASSYRGRAILALLLASLLWLSTACSSESATPSSISAASDSSVVASRAFEAASSDASPFGTTSPDASTATPDGFDLSAVPAYFGQPSVAVNGNVPFFTEADSIWNDYGCPDHRDCRDHRDHRGHWDACKRFAPLDGLGRCGAASMVVSPSTMPVEERGSIGMVKPSGWHTVRYDWVDGEYLYNRCHLLGYQLSGENANELNLITGTRTMNTEGMLPYENQVAEYVERTGGQVLLRVTPVFEGDNLVANGVLMEAQSLEDAGAGVRFCVWCYNVEPGVAIDYATGESMASDQGAPQDDGAAAVAGDAVSPTAGMAEGDAAASAPAESSAPACNFVLNTNSHKFHHPNCSAVSKMKDKNKAYMTATRDEVIAAGYDPCGICQP